MDSSGFSSPRSDCFPAGLRVLVVDDDPTWLKILEKMLKKCNYEVTTCNLARDALNLLRERKDGFDIVISDVNMPDMDGFKLLEHVGLEMDLPVIMMSVDGETSRVMKGVQHGACDYLLKPIRMKELRNIWQHVLRKRMHGIRDVDGLEEIHTMMSARHGGNSNNEHLEDFFVFAGDMALSSSSGKKRKDENCGNHEDSSHSTKKARVVWTVDLHQKFVKAVNQIGFEKAGPKKILDLMGVPRLTRENVASHLQKYRLYLTRLQKENELKAAATFCGINKSTDIPSKKPIENITAASASSSGAALPILAAEPEKSDKGDRRVQAVVGFDPCSGNNIGHGMIELKKPTTKVESIAMLFSVQPEGQQTPCTVWSHGNLFGDVKSSAAFQGNLLSGETETGGGGALRRWDEEFDAYSCQGMGFYPELRNMEPVAYDSNGEVVIASSSSSTWGIDCETVEYPIMDQGLFIA